MLDFINLLNEILNEKSTKIDEFEQINEIRYTKVKNNYEFIYIGNYNNLLYYIKKENESNINFKDIKNFYNLLTYKEFLENIFIIT